MAKWESGVHLVLREVFGRCAQPVFASERETRLSLIQKTKPEHKTLKDSISRDGSTRARQMNG